MAMASRTMMGLGLAGVAAAVWLDARILSQHGATVRAAVAVRTIPPYTLIQASDVAHKTIPSAAAHADDVADPVGRLTTLGIPMGSPVQAIALAPPGNLVQYAQAQGLVLTPVAVQQTPVSALVQPGMTVHLLVGGVVYPRVPVVQTGGGSGFAIGFGGSSAPATGQWLVLAPWREAQAWLGQTVQVLLGAIPSGATVPMTATGATDGTGPYGTSGGAGTTGTTGTTGTLAQPPSTASNGFTLPQVAPGQTVILPSTGTAGTTGATGAARGGASHGSTPSR